MNINKLVAGAVMALAAAGAATVASATTYTYVGSWFVDSGEFWGDNPAVYSGQEAAAFLFGGAAGDYAISTNGTDTSQVNLMAFYDGWGDGFTCGFNGPCAQNLHVDVDNDGYAPPGGFDTAFSAYVSDHGVHLENFAFRVDGAGGVPEAATWALMISGFGLAGATLRRRRAVAA